jgi:hypothetical protein
VSKRVAVHSLSSFIDGIGIVMEVCHSLSLRLRTDREYTCER